MVATPSPGFPVYQVLNSAYQQQDSLGVNGPRGFSSGSYTDQLQLEGSFTLNFPNSEGEDGVLHRHRFMILTYPDYHVGDEWFEIWQEENLLFVGTPTGCQIDDQNIQITGVDGWWLLNKVRETAAGVWWHAPRDVMARYSQAWVGLVADNMMGHPWVFSSGAAQNDGNWRYTRAEQYGEGVRLRPNLPNTVAEVCYTPQVLNAGTGPTQKDWSVEWDFTRSDLYTPATVPTSDGATTASYIRIGFYLNSVASITNEIFELTISEGTIFARSGQPNTPNASWKINTKINTQATGLQTVKFEQRDYWMYIYTNTNLIACLPMHAANGQTLLPYQTSFLLPFFRLYAANLNGGDEWAVVQNFTVRQSMPLLQRHGDVSAVQNITITGATGGTYTISYKGATSGAIGFATNPSALVNAMSTITADGGVTVSGTSANWVLTWTNPGQRSALIATSSLTGVTPTIAISYGASAVGSSAFGSASTDTGDLVLPGSYPPDGITGYYEDCSDIVNLAGDDATDQTHMQTLNPLRQPYAERVDRSIFFGQSDHLIGGGWQPDGPVGDQDFAVRWVGSIYLDTSNADYVLRFSGGRYRVWVGSTRFQDALLDQWLGGIPATNQVSQTGWLVGTSINKGPLYGQKSGFFPVVIEWFESDYPPQLTYQFGSFGGPTFYSSSAWFIPGSVLYGPLQLTRANLVGYWPINSGMIGTGGGLNDESGNGNGFGFVGSTAVHTRWDKGPFVGTIAQNFNIDGAQSQYFSTTFNANLNPVNSKFTITAWIRLNGPALGNTNIIMQSARATSGYSLSINTSNQLQCVTNNASTLAGTTTFVANVWYHVAVTYDGSVARLYVNGILEAGPTAMTYTANTLGDTRVGAGGLFGSTPWTPSGAFEGRISNLVFYNTMVSAANILADYQQRFTVDPVALSPLGVYKANIRLDSHYNQVQTLLQAFGHQMTCAPRALESGEFPGVLAPHVRVGRDTEYVLRASEASGYSKTVDATEVVDALYGDAQGLADNVTGAQITFEQVSGPDVQPGAHMFINQDYDQQSQVNEVSVFQAYLENLLALRLSPWEQLEAQSLGFTQAIDTFPLTGALAAFRWQPGDGVRIDMPKISQVDVNPRQIMGVQWQLSADGATQPVVTFRQRPRDLYRSLRSLQQQIFNAKRNYQLQLYVMTGSIAGFGNQQPTSGGSGFAGNAMNASRCGLPLDLGRVVRMEVVVQSLSGSVGTPHIWINSNAGGATDTGIVVTRRGRYDVTGFLGRSNGTDQFVSCFFRDTMGTAIPASAAYGGNFHLELLVKG
jgi:hypothetical protein